MSKNITPTTWGADLDSYSAANHVVITLDPKFMLYPWGINHNNIYMNTNIHIIYNILLVLDTVHTLLSKIWKRNIRCSRTKWFALSENTKDKIEWPLASAYMLYLYKSHWSYILDQKLTTWRIAKHVVTNIRKKVLILVNFQNKYYSINYQIIY